MSKLAAAAALVALATLVAWSIGLARLAETDVVLVYFVVITIAALRFGRATAIFAAALSVAAFDFFFVSPFYTFSVHDSRHLLTFALMFAAGLFVSMVAARLKQQEIDAVLRERRTQSVLALTKATAIAKDAGEAAHSLAQHAASAFLRETAVFAPNERGELSLRAACADADVASGKVDATTTALTSLPTAREQEIVAWVRAHGCAAGRGTATHSDQRALALPLVGHSAVEGVLLVRAKRDDDPRVLDADALELADAFARQTAVALERLRLADEARVVALRRRTDEMRTSLLSAVSHDLRTPLGAITGAATTLLDEAMPLPAADRRALLESVAGQAVHLERLVGSLLDMTRVESGALVLKKEWIPIEELVGSALARSKDHLLPRRVATTIAGDIPLLHVDVALFEQVLVNLLDNAAKYTPPGASIEISAALDEDGVRLVVEDDGPGLPDGIDVFEKFVRGPASKAGGLGLGLAICKSVVEAHGGSIRAEARVAAAGARSRTGARFVIALPPPPPAPNEGA